MLLLLPSLHPPTCRKRCCYLNSLFHGINSNDGCCYSPSESSMRFRFFPLVDGGWPLTLANNIAFKCGLCFVSGRRHQGVLRCSSWFGRSLRGIVPIRLIATQLIGTKCTWNVSMYLVSRCVISVMNNFYFCSSNAFLEGLITQTKNRCIHWSRVIWIIANFRTITFNRNEMRLREMNKEATRPNIVRWLSDCGR